MVTIFVEIEWIKGDAWISLITEAHKNYDPWMSDAPSLFAFDWQVCPRSAADRTNNVMSGSCFWQTGGIDEYTEDLSNNLQAGIVACAIAADYHGFLQNPTGFLNEYTEVDFYLEGA